MQHCLTLSLYSCLWDLELATIVCIIFDSTYVWQLFREFISLVSSIYTLFEITADSLKLTYFIFFHFNINFISFSNCCFFTLAIMKCSNMTLLFFTLSCFCRMSFCLNKLLMSSLYWFILSSRLCSFLLTFLIHNFNTSYICISCRVAVSTATVPNECLVEETINLLSKKARRS